MLTMRTRGSAACARSSRESSTTVISRHTAALRLSQRHQPATAGRRTQVCRYKESEQQTREADAAEEEGYWSRFRPHFHEKEGPDESEGVTALLQRTKEATRDLPISLPDLLLPLVGGGVGYALAESANPTAIALGLGGGVLARALQAALLEQTVPFTRRRHTLLLPVGAELTMGSQSYQQVLNQPDFKGKILPEDHPDARLVQRIASRIIDAVEQAHGGGFQDHIKKFEWEVAVVNRPDVNAFVLPGGKVVVFTGILDLMNRDEDMLATIIGHEAAHAVARHSGEKLTLGLFVAGALQLALAYFGGGRGGPGGPGGYGQQRNPYGGRGPAGYPGRSPAQQGGRGGYGGFPPQGRYRRGAPPPYYLSAAAAGGGLPPGASAAGPSLGGALGNPRLLDIAVNLLLQLPFSRRAEAEADLIGLKLMTLAGYNPDKAPVTFAKMEEYQNNMSAGGGRPGGVRLGQRKDSPQQKPAPKDAGREQQRRGPAGLMSAVQTHPRSASRVKLLEGELEKMRQVQREEGTRMGQGNPAAEVVLSKVPYWML